MNQSGTLERFTSLFLEISAIGVSLAVFAVVLVLAWMYFRDINQSRHAIRRNFPIIGRFRYFFEHLGEFFRPYVFAMDREELPFNRAQRSWVYRAAKNLDTTTAFGSSRSLNTPGNTIFLNALFPPLESDITAPAAIVFGEHSAATPFTSNKLVNISAMSFGALSAPAVQALSHGAAKAGIYLNTGEGGLSPYHLEGGCDIVFQIGTAKYGVRDAHGHLSDEKLKDIAAHKQVRMFELKLAQGAKPGKGGILPAAKVTELIASTRGIPVGEASISPNRHTDINSIDELLERIAHIRRVTGKPVGFKTVLGADAWLDELCKTIHQKGLDYAPDFITLDGGDGGSGAAPLSLIDAMGLPLKRALPLLVDTLTRYALRDRVKIIASGKLINPIEVASALCLGADMVNTARGFLFALGCIQALQCNKNTCPTGITTHNKDLQEGLNPLHKAERVAHYADNIAHEVEIIAHSCGVTEPRQLGRQHAQVVDASGFPQPLLDQFPTATVLPRYRAAPDQRKNTSSGDIS